MTDTAQTATPADDGTGHRAPRNQWWDVWDQFKTHKGALIGAAFFLFVVLAVFSWPAHLVNRRHVHRHPRPQSGPITGPPIWH